MSDTSKSILFAPGRLVGGNLYEARTKDMQGNTLTVKSPGPTFGNPRVEYPFAVAIPKRAGQTHWGVRPSDWNPAVDDPQNKGYWGEVILAYGRQMWPQGQAETTKFAWKIVDGDSTEFNEGTPPRRWCDHEGYPGHWVVKFKSGFAPKIYDVDGNVLAQKDYVNAGDFIEVLGTVDSNFNAQKPGIYVNHNMIAFRGYGKRINFGVDVKSVGFGRSALPAGASAVPVGQAAQPSALPGAAPSAAPGGGLPPPPASAAPPAAPTAVQPAPGFLAPPPPGAAPAPGNAPPPPPAAAPAPPAPPAGPKMTAAAAGVTYEQFIAKGWTLEQMIAGGYATR